MSDEKKIIIDEDWKARVDAEREAEREEAPRPAAEASAESDRPANDSAGEPQLPPPSLSFLASTLYYKALIGLGVVPDPISRQTKRHLASAKHSIDLLDILQQKTEGNRTEEETQVLEHLLYELRMAFVQMQNIA